MGINNGLTMVHDGMMRDLYGIYPQVTWLLKSWPIELVDLPNEKYDFPQQAVSLPKGNTS